jgi:hypothetical protein
VLEYKLDCSVNTFFIDTIYELLAAPNAIVADASGVRRFLQHKTDFLPCVGRPGPNNEEVQCSDADGSSVSNQVLSVVLEIIHSSLFETWENHSKPRDIQSL